MKWRVWRAVFVTALSSVVFTPSFSQNYYLVIGAFATESNDIREFTSYLPGNSSDTAYTLTTNNDLLRFYVLKTSNKEEAMANSEKLQQALGNTQFSQRTAPAFSEKSIPSGTIADPNTEVLASAAPGKASDSEMPSSGGVPLKPKGKVFKFSIASEDGYAMPGEVHHVDLDHGREVGSFTTESYIDVLNPGKNEPMTVVCGVFGYKEVEKYVDFSNPAKTEGAYLNDQGAWVIPYKLERVEAGDVSIMYNLSFYKDAVLMLPPSQKDLDALVSLMEQNPNYVIKVHAHCNGRYSRKIITMGEDHNYFSSKGSEQIKASAKELTNLRAETIKSYLTEHGIDKNRIKMYGWGATEMLADENGPHAKLNDRIEIEILKD